MSSLLVLLLEMLELALPLSLSQDVIPDNYAVFKYDSGRLSFYAPNDGHNRGILACNSKRFTHVQEHIAYRKYYKVGCGCKVIVCVEATHRCVITRVMDAGPFGIYKPPLRHAVRDGRYKVWPALRPPKGWQWRGVVDISIALWRKLGKPPFLSKVHLFFLKPQQRQSC